MQLSKRSWSMSARGSTGGCGCWGPGADAVDAVDDPDVEGAVGGVVAGPAPIVDRSRCTAMTPVATTRTAAVNAVATAINRCDRRSPDGTYKGTSDNTRMRGSVISSIAYLSPSRPKPDSFVPPYGIWSARNAETSLMMTPPTSMSR